VDPPTPSRPDPPPADERREAGAASVLTNYVPPGAPPDRDRIGLHVGLFLATFASMVWAGGALVGRNAGWPRLPLDASAAEEARALLSLLADPTFLTDGVLYAVPFLLFLTVHEFGHYTTARLLKTRVSLPYYIPLGPLGFGTLGAVIRIREPLRRTRQLFDIGAAGPLAGFVVALGALVVGALTLPPPEYLLDVLGHEGVVRHLVETGSFPPFRPEAVEPGTMAFVLGDTPLFHLVNGLAYAPVSPDEVIHYPVLLAGWLGLFFTALNLLPVGQLDGGHVVYALFGPAVHGVVARVTVLLLLLSGAVGLVGDLEGAAPAWQVWLGLALVVSLALAKLFEGDWRIVGPGVAVVVGLAALLVFVVPGLGAEVGWTGWLVWVGLLLFVVRVDHPPVLVPEPLTTGRKVLGYLCLVIFALCFSIQPIQLITG
jgi:membrane-associated protease RseP (regulator of RpoE activity)